MFKSVLISAFCLLLFVDAKAQKTNPPDTIIYFRDKAGHTTDKEHVNDVIFIYPADSSSGKKLYAIKEFYVDGTIKLVGTSSTILSTPILEGNAIEYYPNGQKKSVSNYISGNLSGDCYTYYSNGLLHTYSKYDVKKPTLFIEYRDSANNVLTKNGNGTWLEIDDVNYPIHGVQEGQIKDSFKSGEWHWLLNGKNRCTADYSLDKLVSGTYYDAGNKPHQFVSTEKEPEFIGGPTGFFNFLQKTIKFPEIDRRNHTSGRAVVTFIVEKDGTLDDIKVLRSPSETLANEALRVVSLSPAWIPGIQNGVPVRVQYTIPLSFSEESNK